MNRWVAGLFAVLSLVVNAAAREASSTYGAFLFDTNKRTTVLLLVVAAVLFVFYLMRRQRRITRKT